MYVFVCVCIINLCRYIHPFNSKYMYTVSKIKMVHVIIDNSVRSYICIIQYDC